jgi:hypothetical protein
MTGLSPLGRISNLCCFPAIGLTSNSGNGVAKVSYSSGIGLIAKVGKTPSRCHLVGRLDASIPVYTIAPDLIHMVFDRRT